MAEVDRQIDLLENPSTWDAAIRWLLDHADRAHDRLLERIEAYAAIPTVLGRIGRPEDVALLKARWA